MNRIIFVPVGNRTIRSACGRYVVQHRLVPAFEVRNPCVVLDDGRLSLVPAPTARATRNVLSPLHDPADVPSVEEALSFYEQNCGSPGCVVLSYLPKIPDAECTERSDMTALGLLVVSAEDA